MEMKAPLNTQPIQIEKWAEVNADGSISVPVGPLPIQMHNSDGTGRALLKDGPFGADIIRFAQGKGVRNHTHAGAHILFVIKGSGIVEYNGVEHNLRPGVCYMIPGLVDHAIKADAELVMLVVGNDHQSLASASRLDMVLPD
jgi:quercetin dioxygenase-like cupin family protein